MTSEIPDTPSENERLRVCLDQALALLDLAARKRRPGRLPPSWLARYRALKSEITELKERVSQ